MLEIVLAFIGYLIVSKILVWMMPENKVKLATKDNETFLKSLSVRKIAEAVIEYFKSLTKKGG
ncbi:hypothetical protein [Zunongwangia sp.]|uniref:hypothetical protein n=1 Tax=Zunongwangia sp. TaxID=1965325 RepID=UPI003AA940D8